MKNEVTVWLMGGLGNVLFQLFAAKVIQRNGSNVKICDSLLSKNLFTNFKSWTIHQKCYNQLLSVETFNKNYVISILGYISKCTGYKVFGAYFVKDDDLSAVESPNVFGYFQSKKIIEDNNDLLISFLDEIRINVNDSHTDVVFHYRYGDSDWARKYEQFYIHAKELVRSYSGKIKVITDSEDAAIRFFDDIHDLEIVSSSDVIKDFGLIASGKIIICAPSTYSWWAAHVSKSATEIVMPKFLFDNLGFHNKGVKLIPL